MARELADIMAHEHDHSGKQIPRAGQGRDCGDHYETPWWTDVHCTCGILMGQIDFTTKHTPK